jgi:DNA-binding response OmpR family regulator
MRKKILIIEDEISLRGALEMKLTTEGFDVSGASDGKSGLEMALNEKPDLILLDLILPEMDGLTVLKKLRSSKEGEDIPVIILTNLSSSETVKKAMAEGSTDYLVKVDWKLDEVAKKVKKELGLQLAE